MDGIDQTEGQKEVTVLKNGWNSLDRKTKRWYNSEAWMEQFRQKDKKVVKV